MLSNIVQATPVAELRARLDVAAATLATAPEGSDDHRRALRWHEAISAELWYRNARFRQNEGTNETQEDTMREYTTVSEAQAHRAQKELERGGWSVSLVAFNPLRGVYAFNYGEPTQG